jgi:hypothetical protein
LKRCNHRSAKRKRREGSETNWPPAARCRNTPCGSGREREGRTRLLSFDGKGVRLGARCVGPDEAGKGVSGARGAPPGGEFHTHEKRHFCEEEEKTFPCINLRLLSPQRWQAPHLPAQKSCWSDPSSKREYLVARTLRGSGYLISSVPPPPTHPPTHLPCVYMLVIRQ